MKSLREPTRSRLKSSVAHRRGVTTVEFALTLPLLLAIVFGIIEFVRLSHLRHSADAVAYETARYVAVPGANVGEAQTFAKDLLARAGIRNAAVTVNPGTIAETTASVTVQISIALKGNSWLPPRLTSNRSVVRSTRLMTERVAVVQAKTISPDPPSDAGDGV